MICYKVLNWLLAIPPLAVAMTGGPAIAQQESLPEGIALVENGLHLGVPADHDWTGFYAGLHGGYAGLATQGVFLPAVREDWEQFIIGSGGGAFGGVHAGILVDVDGIVLGIEAAVQSGGIESSVNDPTALFAGNAEDGWNDVTVNEWYDEFEGRWFTETFSNWSRTEYLSAGEHVSVGPRAVIVARAGISPAEGWLISLNAGVAFAAATVEGRVEMLDQSGYRNEYWDGTVEEDQSESSWEYLWESTGAFAFGPVIGTTVETMVTDNISLRAGVQGTFLEVWGGSQGWAIMSETEIFDLRANIGFSVHM